MANENKDVGEGAEPKSLKYASFFSRNKWPIAVAISLVVVVLIVIGLMQSSRKKKEARAFEAHLNAKTSQDHLRVAGQFPNTFYGSVSLLEAGNLLFEKGKYAEARKLYLKFLDVYTERALRAWLHNLVGATFEAEAKYDEAIQYYRRAETSPWLKLQAKLNIGRCFELKGDSEEDPQLALQQYDIARTYYRQLAETTPSSPGSVPGPTPWRHQAQARIDLLTEKERTARETALKKS